MGIIYLSTTFISGAQQSHFRHDGGQDQDDEHRDAVQQRGQRQREGRQGGGERGLRVQVQSAARRGGDRVPVPPLLLHRHHPGQLQRTRQHALRLPVCQV